MSLHHFSFPTAITFGASARKEVAAYLATQKVKRPLLVTDRGIAALPITAQFAGELASASVVPVVFSGVWGNPTASQVSAGVSAYREHRADAVIGFGGGAALDVAKVIALLASHPGDVLD